VKKREEDMKMNWKTCILISGFIGMAVSILSAPGLMNYQGRLTDNTGNPITTSVDVTFTFWNSETGGTQLGGGFSDTYTVTPDAAGIYSTMIGDDPGNLIPASIFTGDSVWLNVNVGGEDLSPRKRITSVGYAVQASHAQTAGDAFSVKKVVRDFVVASGKSVNAGDVVSYVSGVIAKHDKPEEIDQSSFNDGETRRISVARLTDTSFIIAYQDTQNSKYGTNNIGIIVEGAISWLGETIFNQGATNSISVTALSDSEFVVAYRDEANGNKGTVKIGAISGGSDAWGQGYIFNDDNTDNIVLATLSDTEFMVAYKDYGDSTYGNSRKGTVSPGSLSWGSEYTFSSAVTNEIKISALTDKRFAVAFKADGASSVRIGEELGSLIHYGPVSEFGSSSLDNLSLTALSDKCIALAYDWGNGMTRLGRIAGKHVYWGPEVLFNKSDTESISINRLSGSQFVLAYSNPSSNDYGEARIGTISGLQISLSPQIVLNHADNSNISVAGLNPADFVMCSYSEGRVKSGAASFARCSGTVIGIADATGSNGAGVPVIVSGFSDHHTGLEDGRVYYAGLDGTLITDTDAPRVGRAVSGTELLLDIQR